LPSAVQFAGSGNIVILRNIAKNRVRVRRPSASISHSTAENHLTRRLFGSMLRRMEALPLPAG
jgi:hypothetical protein